VQRKREQKGCIVKIGGNWCVRYADWRIENGERVRKQGLTHKLTAVLDSEIRMKRPPKHVEDLAEEFMVRVNGSTGNPDTCSTLSQFVEATWFPFIEGKRAHSTVATYKFYWKHQLKPYVGRYLVRDITSAQAETALTNIAREHPNMTEATLKKLRSMLSGILKRGIGLGLRTGPNPCREIETPEGQPSSETYAYTLDEILQMFRLITHEVARVLIALAAFAGLSKSELQGLTWEAYDAENGEIKVLSGVVNGKRGKTKTAARKNTVPLIPKVRELLDLYRLRLGNPTTGVMFPAMLRAPKRSGRGSQRSSSATEVRTPICLHNLFTRQIDPILSACVECNEPKATHDDENHEYQRDPDRVQWHGWHAFRRGLASNLNELGVPDLTIQRIMRHSDVATTRKSYIKIREDNVTAGMGRLEEEIRRVETKGTEAATHSFSRIN
jgi:integrase